MSGIFICLNACGRERVVFVETNSIEYIYEIDEKKSVDEHKSTIGLKSTKQWHIKESVEDVFTLIAEAESIKQRDFEYNKKHKELPF